MNVCGCCGDYLAEGERQCEASKKAFVVKDSQLKQLLEVAKLAKQVVSASHDLRLMYKLRKALDALGDV